jgi:hypothetical protein
LRVVAERKGAEALIIPLGWGRRPTGTAVLMDKGSPSTLLLYGRIEIKVCVSHISQKKRDTPNFLHAALAMAACAPFFKERRMRSAEPNKLYRKSGIWGTL